MGTRSRPPLAATYAQRGIRVDAVAPGLARPGSERRAGGPSREARAMRPPGRLGEPEDVASATAWLLDSSQSLVAGQVIGVDGGIATARRRA